MKPIAKSSHFRVTPELALEITVRVIVEGEGLVGLHAPID